MPYMETLLALTDHYHALVMNPPYMGSGNMNQTLSDYVKSHYPDAKADLFAVFMQVCEDRLVSGGRYAMINMQSWMFLSSFEALRRHVLSTLSIESMLHLGPRTFDELSGEVVQNTAFVLRKQQPTADTAATYYRLVDGKSCDDKQRLFLSNSPQLIYANVPQKNFEKIPGCPIGYWVSEKAISCLAFETLEEIAHPRRTIQCGDVDRFIRYWFEVGFSQIESSCEIDFLRHYSKCHWFKFSSGGGARKWYGNLDSVLYWKNNGQVIKDTHKAIIPNEHLYFNRCVGYNRITSNGITARLFEQGILLGDATSELTPNVNDIYMLGLLNTPLCNFFMKVFNPTLAAQTGSLSKVPVKLGNEEIISSLVSENISISKSDWDAHETSWDFKRNELVRLAQGGATLLSPNSENADRNSSCEGVGRQECRPSQEGNEGVSLRELVSRYKQHWESQLLRLRRNEEELNREFIAIYGLEDELSPAVPLSEVTILQQGEIEVAGEEE